MPPLHALAAFEAVARHRSFSKAAEELFLTHSAVSHRIRILEEHLDTQLFLRVSKQVVLSAKGEAFLETVRETLMRLHAASSSLRRNARRLLRISVLPAFAAGWLIQRLGDFYRTQPDVELEIQTTGQLANLRAGEGDVGIRFGAGDWPGLVGHKLFTESMYPVASPEYLAGAGPVQDPADLAGKTFLRHRMLAWKPWFDAARLDWPEPASGPVFSDMGFLLEAAISGHGIALARSTLTTAHLDSGRLVQLTDVVAPSDWSFYVVHVPEAASRPEVLAFTTWITATAKHQHRPDFSLRLAACAD